VAKGARRAPRAGDGKRFMRCLGRRRAAAIAVLLSTKPAQSLPLARSH